MVKSVLENYNLAYKRNGMNLCVHGHLWQLLSTVSKMSWSKIFHSVSEKYHALSIAQNRGQKKNSREKCFPFLICVAWPNLLWVLAKIRSKGKATKYNSERPHWNWWYFSRDTDPGVIPDKTTDRVSRIPSKIVSLETFYPIWNWIPLTFVMTFKVTFSLLFLSVPEPCNSRRSL